jgi:hypothetical protein
MGKAGALALAQSAMAAAPADKGFSGIELRIGGGTGGQLVPYTGPTATLKLQAKEGWTPQVWELVHAAGLLVTFPKGSDMVLIPGAYKAVRLEALFGEKKT